MNSSSATCSAICAVLALTAAPALAGEGLEAFKLLPDDGAAGDQFGYAVGISGQTIIIGAPASNTGAVYLFDKSTGLQVGKLLASDGQSGDFFGFAVAISGTTAIVSAYLDDDNGLDSGSAYLFDICTGA